MTNETAQQRAQPDELQKPDDQDPLQAFGSVFRQQLDQAIEPIVANIRRGQPFVPLNAGEQASAPHSESAETVSPTQHSATQVLSLTVDRPQVEGALQAMLDSVVEALFSEDVKKSFRERSQHAVRSLVAAGRDLASEGQEFAVKPKQFAEALDELIEDSFSESIRENVRRNGEQAIRDLIGWDAPAARRAGAKLFSDLAEQRLTAFETFWQQVLVTLLEAGRGAAQPPNGKASDDAEPSSTEPGPDNDIPQTLARSDKRAQDIWVKARDKAAEKDGPGAGAERAAYTALRQHYEKKGDHWEKKTSEQTHGQKSSATGEESGPSRRAQAKTKQSS